MGTLFNQPERKWGEQNLDSVDYFLAEAAKLAKKHKTTISDVIAAKGVLELERQNNLSVADGDAKDEQLAGFGELIREFIDRTQPN